MDIVAGLRRRLMAVGPRRQRRWVPEVSPLEGRTLQTVNASLGFLKAIPSTLAPTGRVVTIAVTGQIGSSSPVPPDAFFFVTDEYRVDEPHGKVAPLTLDHVKPMPPGSPISAWYVFSYSFTIKLQAKRSTRTFDGRHYDLFVGATDDAGTDGITTQILVPKVFHAPKVAKT